MSRATDGQPTTFDGRGTHERRSRLLTADELADRWQVPKSQVWRLTRGGVLQVVRIGRYYRYSVEAVEAFEGAGGAAADA